MRRPGTAEIALVVAAVITAEVEDRLRTRQEGAVAVSVYFGAAGQGVLEGLVKKLASWIPLDQRRVDGERRFSSWSLGTRGRKMAIP